MKIGEIPQFGNLEGLVVVFIGNTVAAPFAAELLAENGANTICVENSRRPDIGRVSREPFGFLTEHKNELCVSIDMKPPEGKDVFLRLMQKANIFIEGLKGGTFDELGLSDERLWQVNSRLSIVHVSGYGETGLPEYVKRASYDPIGQASGGFMEINGFPPPSEPLRAPYTCDYITALFACWSGLAGYIGALRTGRGESVDVSQMEVMWKTQFGFPMEYFQTGKVRTRNGNSERDYLGLGAYLCSDGRYIYLCCAANGPIRRMLDILGMADDPAYQKNIQLLPRGDMAAEKLELNIRKFCLEHTSEEVDSVFNGKGIPCSMIYSIETIQDNPQAKARELFMEWEDKRFGKLRAVGMVPKMKVRPGRIWSGAHDHGEDSRDVFSELGYAESMIDDLYERGIISNLKDGGFFGSKKLQIK